MQIVLNGLISGAAIALLAVAFQAVYLPTRIFFVGVAGIYALAPFLTRFALSVGLEWYLAIAFTVTACAFLSLLCGWLNHGPLARRHASDSVHLIASLGSYIVLVQTIAMIWGNDSRTLRSGVGSTTYFAELIVTDAQWVTLGVSCVLLLGFAILLMHTGLGLRLRALADNPTMFALFGYNVSRHRVFAFVMSGVFASAASLVSAYDLGFDPHRGLHAVLLAIVSVIIGGQSSFSGPVVGALLLGVLRSQVVWYSSARWQEAATFGLLTLFLILRPQGLLGQRTRLEATR
jgi:branched-chain amino acid transport system permease protein